MSWILHHNKKCFLKEHQVLVKMWSNWNSPTLLVGVRIGTTARENICHSLLTLSTWESHSTPRCAPNSSAYACSPNVYKSVHSSACCNGWKQEPAQIPINSKTGDNRVLLYSTGNYIQYLVISHSGKEYEKVHIYVHIYTHGWITVLYTRN